MKLTHKELILFLILLCGILFFSYEKSAPVAASESVAYVQGTKAPTLPPPSLSGKYKYLEITESCDPDFEGHCMSAYAGPGFSYDKVAKLRTGMVLKVKNTVEKDGIIWYRVYFDEWLRYPERVDGEWYVPALAGRIVMSDGVQTVSSTTPKTSKRIVVDLSENMLYAYDGNTLFLSTWVATGVDFAPTPTGTFIIYKKTPSRYMQGPLPGVNDNPFDLPGVPWDLYFTEGGAVIHGSYWHDRYASEQSSGCVNLPPELAKILYDWAPLGTTVTIRK